MLTVKQSDKFQFAKKYHDKKKKGELIQKANKNSSEDFYDFKKIPDVQINLETLIQIIGAFEKNAHFAYTKKSSLLKPNSNEYKYFSSKINDFFITESMINIILLYKKAEFDKKKSEDNKSPSPYYLLNFLGYYLGDYLKPKEIDKKEFLENITIEDLKIIYEFFKKLPSKYYEKYNKKHYLEYNQMIKRKVDEGIMKEVLGESISGLQEFNKAEYLKFVEIFKKNQRDF